MKEVKITKRAHDEIRRSFSSRAQINSLRTDPELTEIVDNFAFDKTLQQSEGYVLEKTRVMCILAATIGCNAINEFKLFLGNFVVYDVRQASSKPRFDSASGIRLRFLDRAC